jgi:hypothetical protein
MSGLGQFLKKSQRQNPNREFFTLSGSLDISCWYLKAKKYIKHADGALVIASHGAHYDYIKPSRSIFS